jgi:hypothetical protein
MLLTNMLHNGGNGTFTLHAYAKDLGGRQVKLGSKTIKCDNAHAVKPFGAIDTPDQGGEASGSKFRNQGWVLTPNPNKIPVNGSTIKVYIDGKNIGNVHYNIYRADIASFFPGYANSNGSLGYLDFDTTAYESGVHTIQWVATDTAGNTDGIGSRYFSIQNSGYDRSAGKQFVITGKTVNRRSPVPELAKIPMDAAASIRMRTGYGEDSKSRKMIADKNGAILITLPQEERMVLDVSQPLAASYSAYMIINGGLRPLPPGASLDKNKGFFYWLSGPASYGKYHLVFIAQHQTGAVVKKYVTLDITPKFQ